jgi:hypothetical protein
MQPWLNARRHSSNGGCAGVSCTYTAEPLGNVNFTSPSAFRGPGRYRTR